MHNFHVIVCLGVWFQVKGYASVQLLNFLFIPQEACTMMDSRCNSQKIGLHMMMQLQ